MLNLVNGLKHEIKFLHKKWFIMFHLSIFNAKNVKITKWLHRTRHLIVELTKNISNIVYLACWNTEKWDKSRSWDDGGVIAGGVAGGGVFGGQKGRLLRVGGGVPRGRPAGQPPNWGQQSGQVWSTLYVLVCTLINLSGVSLCARSGRTASTGPGSAPRLTTLTTATPAGSRLPRGSGEAVVAACPARGSVATRPAPPRQPRPAAAPWSPSAPRAPLRITSGPGSACFTAQPTPRQTALSTSRRVAQTTSGTMTMWAVGTWGRRWVSD